MAASSSSAAASPEYTAIPIQTSDSLESQLNTRGFRNIKVISNSLLSSLIGPSFFLNRFFHHFVHGEVVNPSQLLIEEPNIGSPVMKIYYLDMASTFRWTSFSRSQEWNVQSLEVKLKGDTIEDVIQSVRSAQIEIKAMKGQLVLRTLPFSDKAVFKGAEDIENTSSDPQIRAIAASRKRSDELEKLLCIDMANRTISSNGTTHEFDPKTEDLETVAKQLLSKQPIHIQLSWLLCMLEEKGINTHCHIDELRPPGSVSIPISSKHCSTTSFQLIITCNEDKKFLGIRLQLNGQPDNVLWGYEIDLNETFIWDLLDGMMDLIQKSANEQNLVLIGLIDAISRQTPDTSKKILSLLYLASIEHLNLVPSIDSDGNKLFPSTSADDKLEVKKFLETQSIKTQFAWIVMMSHSPKFETLHLVLSLMESGIAEFELPSIYRKDIKGQLTLTCDEEKLQGTILFHVDGNPAFKPLTRIIKMGVGSLLDLPQQMMLEYSQAMDVWDIELKRQKDEQDYFENELSDLSVVFVPEAPSSVESLLKVTKSKSEEGMGFAMCYKSCATDPEKFCIQIRFLTTTPEESTIPRKLIKKILTSGRSQSKEEIATTIRTCIDSYRKSYMPHWNSVMIAFIFQSKHIEIDGLTTKQFEEINFKLSYDHEIKRILYEALQPSNVRKRPPIEFISNIITERKTLTQYDCNFVLIPSKEPYTYKMELHNAKEVIYTTDGAFKLYMNDYRSFYVAFNLDTYVKKFIQTFSPEHKRMWLEERLEKYNDLAKITHTPGIIYEFDEQNKSVTIRLFNSKRMPVASTIDLLNPIEIWDQTIPGLLQQ